MIRTGIWCWAAVLVAGALALGCKRQPPASSTAAPPDVAGLGTNAEAPPVVVGDNTDPGVVLKDLSLQLRVYVMRSKKAPASFEEFLRDARVEAPPPPEGKKYAISQGAVILVTR
ncbi:conserved exported hypothetical protein [Verrucomicrobia bacterium]|nr:conserved exported hypothetical protein [Verrucomicrobiota bacterium]